MEVFYSPQIEKLTSLYDILGLSCQNADLQAQNEKNRVLGNCVRMQIIEAKNGGGGYLLYNRVGGGGWIS